EFALVRAVKTTSLYWRPSSTGYLNLLTSQPPSSVVVWRGCDVGVRRCFRWNRTGERSVPVAGLAEILSHRHLPPIENALPLNPPTMRTVVKPFGLVFYVMVVVWSGRGLRGSLL